MNTNYEEFDNVVQKQFEIYRDNSSMLFDYLATGVENGFESIQFSFYRANYFYRTYATIPSICILLKAAAEREDEHTLRSAGQNLQEELGLIEGNKKSHAELLRFSHNTHGERVFNLPSISLRDSLNSDFILPTTKTFKKVQHNLYTSRNYIEILAANYAQEAAAVEMLNNFLNAFFKPYSGFYQSKQEFLDIIEYFTCHLDGLEQRHAEDAKRNLFKQCKSTNDVRIAVLALKKMLSAQSNMWNELQIGLSKLENIEQIILTNA